MEPTSLAWISAEWSEHSAFCTSSTFQLAQTCFSLSFHPERPTHHAIADAHKSIPRTSFSSLPLFRPEHGMMSFGPVLPCRCCGGLEPAPAVHSAEPANKERTADVQRKGQCPPAPYPLGVGNEQAMNQRKNTKKSSDSVPSSIHFVDSLITFYCAYFSP